jgi:hypothetical protein
MKRIMIMLRKQIVSKEGVQLLIYLNSEKQLPSDLAETGQVERLVETNSGTPLSQQATNSVLVGLWLLPSFLAWVERSSEARGRFHTEKKTYRVRSRGLPSRRGLADEFTMPHSQNLASVTNVQPGY